MSEEDPLVPVFMPALVVLLADLERRKGSPLTRQEVLEIRDKGTCTLVRRSLAKQLTQSRGYPDLDPDNCWEEWQASRAKLVEGQGTERS